MKYLRRLIWWIATHLLWLTLILGLMTVVFYYTMNMTNIYVVLKDGMAKRAAVVMTGEGRGELDRYFQQSFLNNDAALLSLDQGTSPYQDYNIRGMDHRLALDFAWLWPWDEAATVTMTERIPRIDGRAKGTRAEALIASGGSRALYPPSWQAGRYSVKLVRENGRWRVKSLVLLQVLNDTGT